MNSTDTAAEISALFERTRKKMLAEQERALGQLARAEAAALKPFQTKAPATNGAKRTRGTRLDPTIQQAVLAVLTHDIGYTVKELAKMSKASRSQVRTTVDLAVASGKAIVEGGKRNRKFKLAQEDSAHAD